MPRYTIKLNVVMAGVDTVVIDDQVIGAKYRTLPFKKIIYGK
jgi:hypothetical protein